MVGIDKIVDGEIFLAIEETGAAPDDLLEFDHRVDRTHEDDIADVARIHAGGKFLRGGQNGGDGLFVILKFAQVLLAQLAIIGSDADAVHWVCASL